MGARLARTRARNGALGAASSHTRRIPELGRVQAGDSSRRPPEETRADQPARVPPHVWSSTCFVRSSDSFRTASASSLARRSIRSKTPNEEIFTSPRPDARSALLRTAAPTVSFKARRLSFSGWPAQRRALSIGTDATCTAIRTAGHIGILACRVCRNRLRIRRVRNTVRATVTITIHTAW
jgi:hypothetical protein